MSALGDRRFRACDPPRGRRDRRPPRLIAWLPVAALWLLGCSPVAPVTVDPSLPSTQGALRQLDGLPSHRFDYYQVTDQYQRSYFGEPWWDADNNGRGTRDDVLAAQLASVVLTHDNTVATGAFVDPYTGLEIEYVRGRDEEDPVVVDHVVSLWEAWATGAWAWTQDQRLAFANDPLNLVATTYAVNETKGPQNAARWHPTVRQQECEFALRVVATKAKYNLEVHDKDRAFLREVLSQC